MKKNPKSIRLSRETLLLLEQPVLEQAAGGGYTHVSLCAGKC